MIIRPEAEADLADAQDWYDQQREGLGAEFLLCVEEVLERINRHPMRYAVIYESTRRALLRRFPYTVYYLLEGAEVVVLSVLHMRRNPQDWQFRSPS